MSSKLSSKPWNPETDEETEAPAPPRAPGDEGEPAPRLLRQSRLSPEERLDLETSSFQPGAVYEEVSWTKTAREGLGDIQAKIDRMRGVEGRPERKRPAPKSRTGRLPTGLRSRIREALGSIAHVRLVYATKEHHICRVGLRDGVDVEEVIVVVGPDDVRQVESVLEAVDQLPAGETPSAETTSPEQAPAADDVPSTAPSETDASPSPFGDIHPVIDVEGIGETYEAALSEQGIETTNQLWRADTNQLAEAIDVSPKVVARWQAMAELMALDGIGPQYAELLVRAGFETIDALATEDPQAIVDAVAALEADMKVRIQGNKVGIGRAERWVQIAKDHQVDQAEVDQAEAI